MERWREGGRKKESRGRMGTAKILLRGTGNERGHERKRK